MSGAVGFAIVLGLLVAGATPAAQYGSWVCARSPVEPCATRHGRLSSQNGIPLRLWLVGARRVVAISNDVDQRPAIVRKYLSMTSEDHSYVFGDFTVCLLEPDRPGHARRACLAGATKLVVQPLRRPGPAFRLLSTWPAPDQRR